MIHKIHIPTSNRLMFNLDDNSLLYNDEFLNWKDSLGLNLYRTVGPFKEEQDPKGVLVYMTLVGKHPDDDWMVVVAFYDPKIAMQFKLKFGGS